MFRPNKNVDPSQYLRNKGKTKHIEFSEKWIDRFMAHSTNNFEVASNTKKSIHPALNIKKTWFLCQIGVAFNSSFPSEGNKTSGCIT